MMHRKYIHVLLSILILNGLYLTSIIAQEKQEIVITLSEISKSNKIEHFNNAEALRKQMKFYEAIEEYQKVIALGESCGKEAEAHYNIGLCYTWLMKLDKAEAVFQEIIKQYPNDGVSIAFAEFCLSWIDVQRRNFDTAIKRLQRSLEKKQCDDIEHCAVTQFEIGRIFLFHLKDDKKAKEAFNKVLINYPNTKIAQHWLIGKVTGNE